MPAFLYLGNAHFMMLFAYRLLLILLWPLVLIALFQQAKKRSGGWLFVRQRLGLFTQYGRCKSAVPECRRVWFHAASVGEVMAVLPVLTRFLKPQSNSQLGAQALLVTVNTPEALRLIQVKFPDALASGSLRCCYCPFDFPYALRRFFKSVSVAKLVVVETELWPNLYKACADRSIEIAIINGRLSAKTTQANGFIRGLYGQCLQSVSAVWAKSDTDAQSFVALGAQSSKVEALGNIKFSAGFGPCDTSQLPVQDYLLGLSTHPKEELLLAKAWRASKVSEPLVIVPRHPVRAAEIADQLAAEGFGVARRSLNQQPVSASDIYLADTLGEVGLFLSSAKLVLMGGSWVPVGGHNMLEPAAAGCATMTGPYLDNFKEESDYLLERGALEVVEQEQLAMRLQYLLEEDDSGRKALAVKARQAIVEAQDVFGRYWQKLEGFLLK